jgi:hypothetical protein
MQFTDRPLFRTHFKEHKQEYRHNSRKPLNAKHLSENNHLLQSIDNSIHILHTAEKGRLSNIVEDFYIHRESTAINGMTAKYNILSDMITRHTQPPYVTQ